jgi:hypothetical protein
MVKITQTCIDCGAKRTASPSCFKQPPETYRCRSCNNKHVAKDPSWLKRKTEGNRNISKDPLWQKNHLAAMQLLHKDPDWIQKNKVKNQKLPESLLWQKNHTKAMQNRTLEWDIKQKLGLQKRNLNPIWRENLREANRKLESRIKKSATMQGITIEEWNGFFNSGKYCRKWIDPKLKVRKRVRAFFNDICLVCGRTFEQNNNVHMAVHHISKNKGACCEGNKEEWLFATLCRKCHPKYDAPKKFAISVNCLKNKIMVEYNGKCMYSLDEYNLLYPNGSDTDHKWGTANGR